MNRQVALAALLLAGCQQEEQPKQQAAQPAKASPMDLRREALTAKYELVREKLREHPLRDDWSALQEDQQILETEIMRIDPFYGLTFDREDGLDQKAIVTRNIGAADRILNEQKRP